MKATDTAYERTNTHTHTHTHTYIHTYTHAQTHTHTRTRARFHLPASDLNLFAETTRCSTWSELPPRGPNFLWAPDVTLDLPQDDHPLTNRETCPSQPHQAPSLNLSHHTGEPRNSTRSMSSHWGDTISSWKKIVIVDQDNQQKLFE